MFFKKKNAIQEQTKIQASADKLFSQKKYQKALNEYLKLTKLIPDDLLLLNKIGDSYSKIKDFKNAFVYFERVANHHSSTGFLPKAIAVYKKILKLDPEHTEARESLVKLYLQKDLTSEAKAELKNIAEFYLENNLTTRALDTFKKLVELEPSNIQYHNQLAEILIKEGRSKEACQQFYEMARSFRDKDMIQQAKMVVQKALNLDPNHPNILIISANMDIKEGSFDKGVSKLQKVLTKDPSNLEALEVMGNAFFEKGDFDRAHQCFINILQKDSSRTKLVEKLVRALLEENQLNTATEYLKPLNKILIAQKKQEEAISLVRNILEIDEVFEPAVYSLVDIYTASNMASNAILILEKTANHYINQNQPTKAAPLIERILQIDPDNLEWLSQLETAKRPLGQTDVPRHIHHEPSPPPEESSLLQSAEPQEPFQKAPSVPEPAQSPEYDHLDIDEISALVSGDLDASSIEDTSTSIKNQLTEVEIFIRHGLTDRAQVHLNKIVTKFPDHFEANAQLRQIYLEQNNLERAADCDIILAEAYIDKGELDLAIECIEEAEPYRPGAVRKLRGLLEMRENADVSATFGDTSAQDYYTDLSSDDLDPEFSSKLISPPENLIIEPPDEEAVVSIEHESTGFNDFDAPQTPKSASDDSIWALDIPAVTPETPVEEDPETDATGDDSEIIFDFMDDDAPVTAPAEPASTTEQPVADEDPLPDKPKDDFEFDLLRDGIADDIVDEIMDGFPDGTLTQAADQHTSAIGEKKPQQGTEAIQIPLVDDNFEEKESFKQEQSHDTSDSSDSIIDLADLEDEVESHQQEEPGPLPEPDPEPEIEPALAPDLELELETASEPEPEPETEDSINDSVLGEIEEIDFFISMEAFQEAQNLVQEAIEKHGPLPELLSKQQEIPAIEPTPPPEPVEQKPEADLFDLASVLNEEFFYEEKEITDNSAPEEFQSVEELFKEFKKGVAEQIADTDYQTHYDLGIGYKEMGLLKEGISEFEIAMGDPDRLLDCVTMISICKKELGKTEEAIAILEEAIAGKTLDQERQHILLYELATTFEGQGDLEKAIEIFREIETNAPEFRDIQDRIEMLI